jgi:cobalt-zinc-cadmium efflux system outer membrane protein
MRKSIGAALLALSLPISAWANVLKLQQAIERAKDHSPEIRSLRFQVASAEAKAWQALAPAEPTLALQFQDMDTPYHGISGQASRIFTLTQPVNFPGKAFLSHSIQNNQANSLRAQLSAMELQISAAVKAAYYQLLLTQQNVALNQEQQSFYERILAIAKRRYEAGSITQVDLLNAEVSLYSNENDLVDLKSTERAARTQLNVLVGQQAETQFEVEPIPTGSKPVIESRDAEDRMVANRSEIRAAKYLWDAANGSFHLAEMSLLPDFQLIAGTTYYDTPEASPLSSVGGSTHTYFGGVQMSVPLWFLFDQRQGIASASRDRAAAEANLQTILNQSKITLDATLDTIEAARKKIDNYQQHLMPLAEQSLTLAIINYGVGKIDFQTLSDTATMRRNTKRDFQTALVNYLTAYTTLGQLIGEDL